MTSFSGNLKKTKRSVPRVSRGLQFLRFGLGGGAHGTIELGLGLS
jgi:hypothetical protein